MKSGKRKLSSEVIFSYSYLAPFLIAFFLKFATNALKLSFIVSIAYYYICKDIDNYLHIQIIPIQP